MNLINPSRNDEDIVSTVPILSISEFEIIIPNLKDWDNLEIWVKLIRSFKKKRYVFAIRYAYCMIPQYNMRGS